MEFDDDTSTLAEDSPPQLLYIPGHGLDDATTVVGDQSEGCSAQLEQANSNNYNVQQLQYNDYKVKLDRSINAAIDILGDLKTENTERPIFYPTDLDESDSCLSEKSRMALFRQNSFGKKVTAPVQDKRPKFEVLKINLKLDQSNVMRNLDPSSLGTLFESKITHVCKHLMSLKERIDDTRSKIFVTGDLNAGKSTFCNALLRRQVLPTDEQPCTNVFCEVVDARENSGLEEVHAVQIGYKYNIKDETTYGVFPLKELEHLVYQSDVYSILKVYCSDSRPHGESLLKNGVIDVCLIDAPGLNLDSYQTTQVFSRQEEIDLVVFVVDAKNHFTLSGREFISSANNEKNLMFIVVNGFDAVKNKGKCKERIMDQVKKLSPDTHKDAGEFVHFVSSENVVENFPDDHSDDDNNDDNEEGDYFDPDFDRLEASLRRFILGKRCMSKLLPAKTYTSKVLKDLSQLFSINQQICKKTHRERMEQLKELTPKFQGFKTEATHTNEKLLRSTELHCSEMYDYSRKTIDQVLAQIGNDSNQLVEYRGIADIYTYAKETQNVMVNTLIDTVSEVEEFAKQRTSEKVEEFVNLGREALENEKFLADKTFNQDLMFSKKKHQTVKSRIVDNVNVLDFFDPNWHSFQKFSTLFIPGTFIARPKGYSSWLKIKGDSMQIVKNSISALAVYSSGKVLNQAFFFCKQFVCVRDLISVRFWSTVLVPTSIGAVLLAGAYLAYDMPFAFQRNMAINLANQLEKLDYVHNNSSRIARECRVILNYPSREIMNSYQSIIDDHITKREKTLRDLKSSEQSLGFYSKLKQEVDRQKGILNELDLESISYVD